MREFAKAFYKSKAWQQCRAGYIAYRRGLDGGMCEICKHCHDVEHGYCEQSKPSRVTFDTDGNPIPP